MSSLKRQKRDDKMPIRLNQIEPERQRQKNQLKFWECLSGQLKYQKND